MLSHKNSNNKLFTLSFVLILITGVAMRCYQYFMGRSLWEDEAHLALNFMSRDFATLLQPLDYIQAAPPLFLLTVKLCTVFFGFGPKSLHLFPFIISVLSLPLYYFLARKLTGRRLAALSAFLLFSVNIALIYFSSELKTYGVDVVMYTVLVWLMVSDSERVRLNRNILLCIVGSLFIFYSNITFIVLFCIGCDLLSGWISNRKVNKQELSVMLCWFVLYVAYYFTFIYHHPHAAAQRKAYDHGFPPLNPFSQEFILFMQERWKDFAFLRMLYITEGKVFGYLLLLVLAAGIIAGIRQKRYRLLLYTIVPVCVHFVLAQLHIYPFLYRFILYIVPGMMILMGFGLYSIARLISRKTFSWVGPVLAVACIYFFAIPSIKEFPLYFKEIAPSLHCIDSFPPSTQVYITTPYTLYKYSYLNKDVRNSNFEALQWPIGPEQYFETVGATQSPYLLLHATDTATDGYGRVLAALREKGLIKKLFEYKTFTVSLVQPLSNNLVILNYQSFPADRTFDLNGKKVTALWDEMPLSAREVSLSTGSYEVTVVSSGTSARGIFPHINVLMNDEKVHSYFTPPDYGREVFRFEQKSNGSLHLKLDMDNDLTDTVRHEDRNAFILYIEIKKITTSTQPEAMPDIK
jgi:hypothetical protein